MKEIQFNQIGLFNRTRNTVLHHMILLYLFVNLIHMYKVNLFYAYLPNLSCPIIPLVLETYQPICLKSLHSCLQCYAYDRQSI